MSGSTGLRVGLVALAVLWPLAMTAAVATRVVGGENSATGAVYLVASEVCHQRTARSFATGGVQWPVCGRCAGLYLSAAVGAVAMTLAGRRGSRGTFRGGRLLALAAAPTVATVAAEWSGLVPVGNVTRALAALPLGAAAAALVLGQLVEPGAHEKGR